MRLSTTRKYSRTAFIHAIHNLSFRGFVGLNDKLPWTMEDSNISAIVGGLYENDKEKKESGFTLFYMSINIGSILGFFICGYLGENIGWHYGFGAAGIGMAFGLIQFYLNKKDLFRFLCFIVYIVKTPNNHPPAKERR